MKNERAFYSFNLRNSSTLQLTRAIMSHKISTVGDLIANKELLSDIISFSSE